MYLMPNTVSELLDKFHKKNLKLAFILAGGGVGLFDLFKTPGASRVLTEARLLYSRESFESFLAEPLSSQFVSQDTADRLAIQLDLISESDICFAFTCALTTDRERKGANRGYLSLCRQQQIIVRQLIEVEGKDRADQDSHVTQKVLERILHYKNEEI